ncbi:MAG: NAD(P)-binding protein [Henriciella sp.]|nr:NAD(P)-binding protein [Henriciella sp.]MBO6696970.1 NAD(P)-binding protein [Henriciella sp.]
MNIIVGSGPAGVSVAMALIARGQSVTMLDGGQTLSATLAERQNTFAAKPPADWSNDDTAAWQAPQLERSGDLAMRHGSSHAQVPKDETFVVCPTEVVHRFC